MNNIKYTKERELVWLQGHEYTPDRELEINTLHASEGFTERGTYILFEAASELSYAEQYFYAYADMPWAIDVRFEEFTTEIEDWSKFRDFLKLHKSQRKPFVEESIDAREWLQGNTYQGICCEAKDLELVKAFKTWYAIQQQHALLKSLVPSIAAPKVEKQRMKI